MSSSSARISARPAANAVTSTALGGEMRKLGILPDPRDGAIFVPRTCKEPTPMILMLHGAGGTGSGAIKMVSKHAEQHGVMVVAPESQRSSWDMISGPGFGPDVASINKVLSEVFQRYNVDPEKTAIAGFSDGASYALSLGVSNGDLFPYVLAFSPGFMKAPARVGRPNIFISHGSDDNVLPIERCGRRLAKSLEEDGYSVEYHEFQLGHVVPLDMVEQAMKFMNLS